MNVATGAPTSLSVWFALVNVTQAVVTVAVLTYRRHQVLLRDPIDLARLLVAVATGTGCAALLATTYFARLLDAPASMTFASAKADLEQLRRIGVRVAIDDVGTGFSGLAKIVDLPIDILKIDKQFISGLPHDTRCEAITRAVLSLGKSLGLSVIAEGIESREQWDLLVDWGCEMGQGYLLGPPLAAKPDELRMLER